MKVLRLAVIALVFAIPVRGQDDAGASLTISFMNGVSTFHVGEVIRVELSFRALVPDTYDIEKSVQERSVLFSLDQFHVTPGGRDPLANYFSSVWGVAGDSLSSQWPLTSEPSTIDEDLNEWAVLDKPGHYSLYITSGRVTRRSTTGDKAVSLRSNTLEFEIVPAYAAWQQQALSAAVATLNMDSTTKDQKAAALKTLCYLDTPESARELVQLLGAPSGGDHWDEIAGLSGSSYQSLVVSELERAMSDPDTALTGEYLDALTKLKFHLEQKPLPAYPRDDAEGQKAWQEQLKNQEDEYAALQEALYEKAATLVASKFGAAKAETVKALLQEQSFTPEHNEHLATIPPELIASAFLNLSEDGQWDLLTSTWGRLKIPAMVAPLEKIAEEPDIKYQGLRDLAFRCLHDLDPEAARPIFLSEIEHPHIDDDIASVKGQTLGLLPDKTLPQFDELLATRLAEENSRTMELDAQLIGRYATKAVLPQIKKLYGSHAGAWDCLIEDGLVRYFLRVDADYGVKRLAVAPSACMTSSLAAVVQMKRWNEVEPGIIARMNGPDLWRAGQAAATLAKCGDAAAEKALWQRLEQFHAQWAGRADELSVDHSDMKKDASEAAEFGVALIEAIGKAQEWLLTDDQIGALENLAFGQERENVKQWQWSSPVELDVNFFGEGSMEATVHQYSEMDMASLVSKIEQYPAGTEFRLNVSGPPGKVAAATAAIENAAVNGGLQIEASRPNN